MLTLLRFEFRKLLRMKAFYICFIISFALLFLTLYTTKLFYDGFSDYFIPPTNFSMVQEAISNSSILLILAILTSIYVCDDFSNGTIKNIIGKGYSRNNIFLSKYIVSTIYSILFVIIAYLVSCLLGIIFWDNYASITSLEFSSLLIQLLLVIAYNSIYFTLAFKFTKNGICIALNILGPTIVSLITMFLDAIVDKDNFTTNKYWIDSIMSSIQYGEILKEDLITSLIAGSIYIVISLAISWYIARIKEF